MGAHLRALAVFEIAVVGRDAALAGLAAVAVAARAHRATGFAPEEPGIAEHAIEPRRFRFALHRRRTRNDHRNDAIGNAATAHHGGGDFEVRQPAVGARADEDAID